MFGGFGDVAWQVCNVKSQINCSYSSDMENWFSQLQSCVPTASPQSICSQTHKLVCLQANGYWQLKLSEDDSSECFAAFCAASAPQAQMEAKANSPQASNGATFVNSQMLSGG